MTFRQDRSNPIQFNVPYEIESIKVRSSSLLYNSVQTSKPTFSISNAPLNLISGTRSLLCKRVVLRLSSVHEIMITLRWVCRFWFRYVGWFSSCE